MPKPDSQLLPLLSKDRPAPLHTREVKKSTSVRQALRALIAQKEQACGCKGERKKNRERERETGGERERERERWEPPLSIALAKEGRETDGVLLPLVLPDEEVTLMEFAVLANRSATGEGADVRG